MAGYGEPDWVTNTEDNTGDIVADVSLDENVAAAPTSSATIGGDNQGSGSGGKGGCALQLMSLLNVGLAVLMSALGVMTIIEVHRTGLGDLSEPFLAFYMILFSVLLFIYELMWWSPVPNLNKNVRKNFGFLYGLRGKGMYLIFVGFLCFGLGKEAKVAILNYVTGASFLCGGILHLFVVFFRPETAMDYQAPTAGISSASTKDPTNLSESVV